ncbi:MAG: hypothetical protein IPM25_14270 [Chloracidobacterium sp.]|nr:hypothetical protein [Chloracidobacterium sp.]
MNRHRVTITVLDKDKTLRIGHRTGVSLHCHTLYSKEMLDFVPFYARQFPGVSWWYERVCAKYERETGGPPDFSSGYWEPPLTARALLDSETSSLNQLGLEGIVSITDHDTIQANLDLIGESEGSAAPISMEWTVPFGNAYFHMGVHNLPASRAREISELLLGYTYAEAPPDLQRLRDLLAMMNDMPEVLIVLNHPFWDIEMAGQAQHDRGLREFTELFGSFIHAIEINGFRPWAENELARGLAERLGLPIVSGGDRHCLHANAMINSTHSSTFDEFVGEVRQDRRSNVIILPEYRLPLLYRQISSIAQVLGHYPHFPPERRHWRQRVYFDAGDGEGLQTLAASSNGTVPLWQTLSVIALTCVGHRSLRPLVSELFGTDLYLGTDRRHEVFEPAFQPIPGSQRIGDRREKIAA